jgi:hypothetical protein
VESVKAQRKPHAGCLSRYVDAMAENLIRGCVDLKDTIRRIESLHRRRAEALGLKTAKEISTAVKGGSAEAGERSHGLWSRQSSLNKLSDLRVAGFLGIAVFGGNDLAFGAPEVLQRASGTAQ